MLDKGAGHGFRIVQRRHECECQVMQDRVAGPEAFLAEPADRRETSLQGQRFDGGLRDVNANVVERGRESDGRPRAEIEQEGAPRLLDLLRDGAAVAISQVREARCDEWQLEAERLLR
jgi:hypothetical protein